MISVFTSFCYLHMHRLPKNYWKALSLCHPPRANSLFYKHWFPMFWNEFIFHSFLKLTIAKSDWHIVPAVDGSCGQSCGHCLTLIENFKFPGNLYLLLPPSRWQPCRSPPVKTTYWERKPYEASRKKLSRDSEIWAVYFSDSKIELVFSMPKNFLMKQKTDIYTKG